jgi:hypothetical protein
MTMNDAAFGMMNGATFAMTSQLDQLVRNLVNASFRGQSAAREPGIQRWSGFASGPLILTSAKPPAKPDLCIALASPVMPAPHPEPFPKPVII